MRVRSMPDRLFILTSIEKPLESGEMGLCRLLGHVCYPDEVPPIDVCGGQYIAFAVDERGAIAYTPWAIVVPYFCDTEKQEDPYGFILRALKEEALEQLARVTDSGSDRATSIRRAAIGEAMRIMSKESIVVAADVLEVLDSENFPFYPPPVPARLTDVIASNNPYTTRQLSWPYIDLLCAEGIHCVLVVAYYP